MSIIKLNNRAVKDATAVGTTTALGNLIFISKQTASSSSSVSFTSGIDSTYKEYIFYFNNIHPATDNITFQFNLSTDSGSNYNVTKTTTYFHATHLENDANTLFGYDANEDLAQSTSYQDLAINVGNDNDQGCSGYFHLFEPSSTTFVKHFMANFNTYHKADYSVNEYIAGYGNTTSAVNAIDFKFASGNIDSGEITLFGVA
tara:strand:+ start:480 stop:1085 length:606 start_codon:yes stop_codon:yes gene_type:complete